MIPFALFYLNPDDRTPIFIGPQMMMLSWLFQAPRHPFYDF